MPLSPGDRLGPYEILSAIGAGGMGAVWKALDTRLDRTVAIKTVEGRFSERFEREAKTIASLNHPHICTLHDVGEDYLFMEFIDGEPVKGPLPVAEVVRLGAQIAGALEAAHRKGITHRDLKPGHVLATKAGSVKVIDFGLAKGGPPVRVGEADLTLTKPLTAESTILGTVPYMSPEQLQGHEADARSDIFALGCVLYEMLTGKRAFEGKSQVSIMAAILEHASPDGRFLYSRRTAPERPALVVHDAATGLEIRSIPIPTDGELRRLSVHPNGQRIAAEINASHYDLWMIEGFPTPAVGWERLFWRWLERPTAR